MRAIVWMFLFLSLAAPTGARDCIALERTCVEEGGTRLIDGVPITRDCWRYEERRACLEEVTATDGCATLVEDVENSGPGHCKRLEAGCESSLTDADGVEYCLVESETYGCENEITLPAVNAAWDGTTEVTTVTEDASDCETLASNAACVQGSDTDSDATGFTRNYRCDGVEVNACTELIARGCVKRKDPECDSSIDEACGLKMGEVACTDIDAEDIIEAGEVIVTRDIITNLGTLIEDTSAIDAIQINGTTCTELESTCVDTTPVWRTVSGRRMRSSCWAWKRTLSCTSTETTDTCAKLEANEDCVLTSSSCVATATDGTCVKTEKTYRCTKAESEVDAGDASLLSESEIATDSVEVSTCADLVSDSSCVLIRSECVEPGGTKTIGGVSITKDCWRTEDTYRCTQAGTGTGETVTIDDCAALEEQGCTLVSTECQGEGEDGSCAMQTKVYRCSQSGTTVDLGEDCGDTLCVNGLCEEKDSETSEDFFTGVALLEVARQAGVYGDAVTDSIFGGTASGCSVKATGFSCCRKSNAETGLAAGNSVFSVGLASAASVAWEGIKYVGSPYVYDVLSASESTAPLLTALYGNAGSGVYSPTFSFYGVTVSNTASGWSFGFSTAGFLAAVAVDLAMDYFSCTAEDQTHAMRQSQGLCHYVGSYCKSKSGTKCLEKKESWVCFNSRLALLVQEAARDQLGIGWGSPEAPLTRGLTLEEFQSLDFSKIDLTGIVSEVARVMATAGSSTKPSEAAETRSKARVESVTASGRSSVLQYTAIDTLTERCLLTETGEPVSCESIVLKESIE